MLDGWKIEATLDMEAENGLSRLKHEVEFRGMGKSNRSGCP